MISKKQVLLENKAGICGRSCTPQVMIASTEHIC